MKSIWSYFSYVFHTYFTIFTRNSWSEQGSGPWVCAWCLGWPGGTPPPAVRWEFDKARHSRVQITENVDQYKLKACIILATIYTTIILCTILECWEEVLSVFCFIFSSAIKLSRKQMTGPGYVYWGWQQLHGTLSIADWDWGCCVTGLTWPASLK